MSSSEVDRAEPANQPDIPRDLRQRIQQTVAQMREEGADFQPDESAAPAARKRYRWWAAALAAVIFAEVGVIAMAERTDDQNPSVVAATTPCLQSLRTIEAALDSFRRDEGRLPGTLEMLVPKHVPAIPKPAGAVVEYQSQGDGYVLRCLDL